MRRSSGFAGIALLTMAAGAAATLFFLPSSTHDDTVALLAPRVEQTQPASAPDADIKKRAPRTETEGVGRRPRKVAPDSDPAEQDAVEPPAASAAVPPAGEIASHIALPQVAMPLPRARPTPEEMREQNTLASSLFSELKLPTGGASRPIGFYSAGCLAGGEQLDLHGAHWQIMRPSRNRSWGHPELIKFIERLADDVSKHTDWPGILIGDMAQPRGGPLPSGHASHQIGLDVDIWLHAMPAKPYTRAEADSVPMVSVVKADNKTLDPKLWQPADAAMIKIAAKQPDVERVFVNPAIKKELCRTKTAADEGWITKVRPWYGHDDHMHVRLKCPADTPECREQAPIPDGDGCDKSLEGWFSKGNLAIQERLRTQAPSKRHVLMRELPAACTALLHEPAKSRLATTGR